MFDMLMFIFLLVLFNQYCTLWLSQIGKKWSARQSARNKWQEPDSSVRTGQMEGENSFLSVCFITPL